MLFLLAVPAGATDYEIQVYGSETLTPGATFTELHSNLTWKGPQENPGGLQPSEHALHETLEITHGYTDWFETGFYVFSSLRNGEGWAWVGDHIRPRVRVPPSWGWPVGVSLSAEVGYLRREFSESAWDLEVRPIVDWSRGHWYVSVNPAMDRTIQRYGDGDLSFHFAPAGKISRDVTRRWALGVEYYGALGPVQDFSRTPEHVVMPVVDLIGSPEWELNAGVGFGLTGTSDHRFLKVIIGRRW